MLKPVLENPWVRAAGLLLALVGIVFLGYLLSPVLIPLFAAFMVAYMLDPVVDYFENASGKNRFWKWKLSRGVTISSFAVLALILALCVPLVLIPSVIGQAKGLIATPTQEQAPGEPSALEQAPGKPSTLETAPGDPCPQEQASGGETPDAEADAEKAWSERLADALPLDAFVDDMGWERPEGMDSRAVLASKVGGFVKSHATEFVQSNAASFASAGQWAGTTVAQVFASIGRVLLGGILFLGNFALFAFVAGYLLKDYDRLIARGKDLIPPRYRDGTCRILGDIDGQLKSFIRGQMTVCLCLGSMYAVGLLVCGVPFAILIAAFGMVASFVPYLGVVLTVGPALLMVFLQHGLDWHIVGVLVTFAVAQGLEGNVLTPKIVGDQVGLHPVWVILAILVFGSALGFLGLLVAVPLAASLKVLVVEAVAYYKKSAVFETVSESSSGSSSGGESGES
jgi:predicted PurR-regulated permease PerM